MTNFSASSGTFALEKLNAAKNLVLMFRERKVGQRKGGILGKDDGNHQQREGQQNIARKLTLMHRR